MTELQPQQNSAYATILHQYPSHYSHTFLVTGLHY